MPNGMYGGVRGWIKSLLLDKYCRPHESANESRSLPYGSVD